MRSFVDQAGPLEHRDVLLDRREAHRVMAGQLDDALLGVDAPADDVAPCVIRQGAEHAVEVGRAICTDTTIRLYHRSVKSPKRTIDAHSSRGFDENDIPGHIRRSWTCLSATAWRPYNASSAPTRTKDFSLSRR